MLSAGGPRVDAWLGQARPLRHGRSGAVQWQADDHWAFGQLDLPDADTDLERRPPAAPTSTSSRRCATCGQHACAAAVELPAAHQRRRRRLERYRQFNIGRQQAFIEAGHDAFEGAPAACALGCPTRATGRRLGCMRFLAGQHGAAAAGEPAPGAGLPLLQRLRTASADVLARGAGRCRRRPGGAVRVGHGQHRRRALGAPRRRAGAGARDAASTCRPCWTPRNARCTAALHASTTCTARSTCAMPATQRPCWPCWRRRSPAPRRRCACRPTSAAAELLVEIEAHAFAPGALT